MEGQVFPWEGYCSDWGLCRSLKLKTGGFDVNPICFVYMFVDTHLEKVFIPLNNNKGEVQ